jgi:RNA polymerase subunit RPABC4/transcription elongation factor Spt4
MDAMKSMEALIDGQKYLQFDRQRELQFDFDRNLTFDFERNLLFNSNRNLEFEFERALPYGVRGPVFRGNLCPNCGALAMIIEATCPDCGAGILVKRKPMSPEKVAPPRRQRPPKETRKPRPPKKPERVAPPPERRAKYEICPNCAVRMPVGTGYCPRCGINVKQWKDYLAAMARRQQATAHQDYRR